MIMNINVYFAIFPCFPLLFLTFDLDVIASFGSKSRRRKKAAFSQSSPLTSPSQGEVATKTCDLFLKILGGESSQGEVASHHISVFSRRIHRRITIFWGWLLLLALRRRSTMVSCGLVKITWLDVRWTWNVIWCGFCNRLGGGGLGGSYDRRIRL